MEMWKSQFDFIGLSTEDKPTENAVDGTTYYCVDTVELYVFYKNEWYLQEKSESEE